MTTYEVVKYAGDNEHLQPYLEENAEVWRINGVHGMKLVIMPKRSTKHEAFAKYSAIHDKMGSNQKTGGVR